MSVTDRSRLPAVASDPPFTFPEIHRTRLSNGLSVWRADHRTLPIVTCILLVRSGSAADPVASDGLASITGDMLDEGSGDRSAIEIHEEVERIGGNFSTEVGSDSSVVVLTTLSRYLARGLMILADIAVRPRFDPQDFARVRELRINRLTQLRDAPSAVADRAFIHLVYGGHPYGHQAIGSERTLRRLTVDDAVAFHRATYRPSRATLVIAGDVHAAELIDAAEVAFAGWHADAGVSSITVTGAGAVEQVPETRPRLAIVERPAAAQSELRVGHIGTSRQTPDYHVLLVLNMILGGQFVSRINLNLREARGFTYGARSGFDCRIGRGPFLVQTSVQTAATAEAIREIRGEIEAIRDSRPATAEEIHAARAALTRGYPRSFETGEQTARALAQLALYDLPDDYFEQFVPRVSAVDAAAVTRVANAHLDPARLTTLIVGDRAVVAPGLKEAGLGDPESVDVP